MSDEWVIERGQIWQRIRDGVEIVIDGYEPIWDDCEYHRRDGNRRRFIFGANLRSSYRLVAQRHELLGHRLT